MTAVSIGDALFTKTQQKVLGLLFGKPDKRFYTNEIMRQVAMGRGTVSRELGRLLAAGLLTASREGNQSYYQANRASPVFDELVAIVKKTFGIADEIRLALSVLDNHIETAFIYGSIAKGTATESSDIDLMLVGEGLSYGNVMEALMPVEASLQREVNPTIYSRNEFNAKLSADNSFIARVMEQPKIMIKGCEDDIGKAG